MEVGNLKVINNNRLIKLFAVGVGNRSGSAVSKSKDISGFKVFRSNPLIYYPEGVYGSCFYFLAVYEDVDKYIGFLAEGAENLFILVLASFGVDGKKEPESFSLFWYSLREALNFLSENQNCFNLLYNSEKIL